LIEGDASVGEPVHMQQRLRSVTGANSNSSSGNNSNNSSNGALSHVKQQLNGGSNNNPCGSGTGCLPASAGSAHSLVNGDNSYYFSISDLCYRVAI